MVSLLADPATPIAAPALLSAVTPYVTMVAGAVLGAALGYLAGEYRRLQFVPVGPSARLQQDGTYLLFYEFRPVTGVAGMKWRSAGANVGGNVTLSTRDGENLHAADAFWDGVPMAGTANLYGKRGLLLFQLLPKGHMVTFYSAGSAPHASQLQIKPGDAGASGFEWTKCKDAVLEISVAAPEAHAGWVRTSIAEVCDHVAGKSRRFELPPMVERVNLLSDKMLVKGSDPHVYRLSEVASSANEGHRRFVKRRVRDGNYFAFGIFRWPDVWRIDDGLLGRIPDGEPLDAAPSRDVVL